MTSEIIPLPKRAKKRRRAPVQHQPEADSERIAAIIDLIRKWDALGDDLFALLASEVGARNGGRLRS